MSFFARNVPWNIFNLLFSCLESSDTFPAISIMNVQNDEGKIYCKIKNPFLVPDIRTERDIRTELHVRLFITL